VSARIPTHLAIIMDGNGRWARARGKPRSEGHRAGSEAARAIVTECRKLGIANLTLYTFSRENWTRPRQEIGFLFDLLVEFLRKELPNLLENDIRLQVLGDLDGIPAAPRQVVKHVMSKTAHCSSMTANLALNYGGRQDIVSAAKKIVRDGLAPEEINEQAVGARLYTAGLPDPDLVIRTSGELRISNFLLFESAYSEFYFTETLWPDFGPGELTAALEDFSRRRRRFGATGEEEQGD
jgi:undecaprenyl diphosphate synthase